MRLLSLQEDGQLSITNDDDLDPNTRYAILSHTWGRKDEEVSFDDLRIKLQKRNNSYGHRKIQFCAKQAAADDLKYFWVDTCCINKENNDELQEAINSMYEWYRNAARCYVYLPDVKFDPQDPVAWQTSFRKSRWFSRGWTLQELLAPSIVEFFDETGKKLGDKTTLIEILHEITGISRKALRGQPLSTFSVEKRFLWARGRNTKREEDRVYCLLGIFGVLMPMIYGEGEVNAMLRLKREINRPRTSEDQKALCTIPLGRNEHFVGREDLLQKLFRMIPPNAKPQDCQRVAIEGLGGIGKTQIALEAGFRLQERDPACSVFWVPAVTRATFENGYRDIARALRLPDIDDDDKVDVKTLVVDALRRSSTKWCLIIDNLDDPDLLIATDDNGAIEDYLPFSTNGSILFTTRNRQVTHRLDIALDLTFRVDEMSESEAIHMLSKAIEPWQMQDQENTRILLGYLAHLPLAIKQAAAYMKRTGITTKKYLESYRRSDQSRIAFLSRDFEDARRYRDSANPITRTWLVSFDHIERHHPLAARYLKLMSFLAEKDIPRELFPDENKETLEMDESIGVLKGYSFITERHDGDSYDIHRLVTLATRNSMEPEEVSTYLNIMAEEVKSKYPYAEHENRYICMRYTPHAEAILACEGTNLGPELRAELLERVGRTYTQSGDDALAKPKYEEALELRQQVLGLAHQDTLTSMSNLATTYSALGDPNKAELMHRRILKLRLDQSGYKHPDTLSSLDNLGNVLRDLRRYQEAERLHVRALVLRQEKFGDTNINTLRSMSNWALDLEALGRHEEAEKVQRRGIELSQKTLGRTHPETLNSMNDLALTIRNLEKYPEAELLLRRCLAGRQQELGSMHPQTLRSLNNLALVLGDLGKFDEAEQMHRHELQLCQQALPLQHPLTLISVSNLALILEKAASKRDEAQELRQMERNLRKEIEDLTVGSWRVPDDIGPLYEHEEAHDADLRSRLESILPTKIDKDVCSAENADEKSSLTYDDVESIPSSLDDIQSRRSEKSTANGSGRESTEPTTVEKNMSSASIASAKDSIVDDDIQSILSVEDDLQSRHSAQTTSYEMKGKFRIGRFLAQDQQFRPLCDQAILQMNQIRFADNVRRLLKIFHGDLAAEAQTEPQKATVKLLRSRRGRYRIGQQIFSILKEEDEDPAQFVDTKSGVNTEDDKIIEGWLATVQLSISHADTLRTEEGPEEEPAEEPEEITEDKMKDRTEEVTEGVSYLEPHDDTDSDSSDGADDEQFPNISELERFFRESQAYNVLLENFTMLFVPTEIRRVFLSIPKSQIWLSSDQDPSAMNRMKLWIEERTKCQWDWWPLAPSKRMLSSEEVRVMWRCHCGDILSEIISAKQSRWVERLKSFPDSTKPVTLCPVNEKDSRSILQKSLGMESVTGGTTASATLVASHAEQRTPSSTMDSTASSTTATSATITTNNTSSPDTVSTLMTAMEEGRSTPLEKRHWVLFGVQGRSAARIPAEIEVHAATSDRDFFRELKSVYAKHRGKFRHWFSIWQLRSCEFVKFQRIDINSMVRECRELPSLPGPYEFTNHDGGVVSRHVFEAFLNGFSDAEIHLEAMSYDFSKPQPVKHAWAYYLCQVFRDWSDDDYDTILEHWKPTCAQAGMLYNFDQ
ncbi:hypothetical protein E8E14_001813 [Neopestalotiopsis sp. 37M]|nr:hypothetical protein E8E14_001813 [Neopestalotiopsis sp. 37M]